MYFEKSNLESAVESLHKDLVNMKLVNVVQRNILVLKLYSKGNGLDHEHRDPERDLNEFFSQIVEHKLIIYLHSILKRSAFHLVEI